MKLQDAHVSLIEDTQEVIYAVQSSLQGYIGRLTVRFSWLSMAAMLKIQGMPDIMLIDINLANINGMEAARRIDAMATAQSMTKPRLICLTASVVRETIVEARPLFDGFVAKPWKDEVLLDTLQRVLNGENAWVHGINGRPIDV